MEKEEGKHPSRQESKKKGHWNWSDWKWYSEEYDYF